MDQARVWLARILAPLAFIAAAVGLVYVVQRALDEQSSSDVVTVEEPGVSVVITTDVGEPETATEPEEQQFYRVKSGDTLEAIAGRFDTTVDALLALNPDVDPLALAPGQRIRVA
jgi:LysM repeat protein